MKYEITHEIRNVVMQVIAKAKETGLCFLELNNLISALQQLPKIEEAVKEAVKDAVKVTAKETDVKK